MKPECRELLEKWARVTLLTGRSPMTGTDTYTFAPRFSYRVLTNSQFTTLWNAFR